MVNEESNINQKTLGEDDANVQRYGEEQNVEEEESSVSKYFSSSFFYTSQPSFSLGLT